MKKIEEIKIWFKDHSISIHAIVPIHSKYKIEKLIWKKPDTNVFMVTYILHEGCLYVSGDLGYTIYRWSDPRCNLEWISTCDLGYFSGKCEASEEGRQFTTWSNEKANESLRQILIESYELDIKTDSLYGENSHEWYDAARQLIKEETDLSEWDILCDGGPHGFEISMRCISHWVGLKMAFKNI